MFILSGRLLINRMLAWDIQVYILCTHVCIFIYNFRIFQLKGIVSRDGYFFLKVQTFQLVLSVYALIILKVFLKLLALTPYNCYLFICFHEILKFIILKMLTETLLGIPFSVIGECSLLPISHWLQGKFARINLLLVWFYRITDGFL
jgi:hypothetical protein